MKTLFIFMGMMCMAILFACGHEETSKGQDTFVSDIDSLNQVAHKTGADELKNVTGDYDQAFAAKALYDNRTENKIASAITGKTKDSAVRNVAQTILRDNNRMYNSLNAAYKTDTAAAQAYANTPLEKDISQLDGKQGIAFDKSAMELLYIIHVRDVGVYQDASARCAGDALREYATTALHTAQTHLDSVKHIITSKQLNYAE